MHNTLLGLKLGACQGTTTSNMNPNALQSPPLCSTQPMHAVSISMHVHVGPIITEVDTHLDYYISHRQERENQVLDLLSSSQHSAASMVKVCRQVITCYQLGAQRTFHVCKFYRHITTIHSRYVLQGGIVIMDGRQVGGHSKVCLWTWALLLL